MLPQHYQDYSSVWYVPSPPRDRVFRVNFCKTGIQARVLYGSRRTVGTSFPLVLCLREVVDYVPTVLPDI